MENSVYIRYVTCAGLSFIIERYSPMLINWDSIIKGTYSINASMVRTDIRIPSKEEEISKNRYAEPEAERTAYNAAQTAINTRTVQTRCRGFIAWKIVAFPDGCLLQRK